jgi:non-ribosomal peptide synthetase component F
VSELQLLGDLIAHQVQLRPGETAARALDRRSNRLGRALVELGVRPGDRVGVLCCDRHLVDRMVGLVGVQKAAAQGVSLHPARPVPWLADQLRATRPRLILACSEGVEAWRTTGVPCQVVGDEPGVTWWKLVEARQSAAPFQVPCCPDDVISLVS